MDIYQKIGKDLMSLRGRSKQADFAQILNVSQPYYSRIEKGENRLQLHQLAQLSKELDITIIITDGDIKITSKISTS